MVYVPEMPRVDVANALSSGFEFGGKVRGRKAQNALARIYAGDESALADLMAADPEAGRQVETQIGARQFVKPATQEQAGPVRPGIDASLEAQPAKVDTEGLTGYLASRGDSGALKALMERMSPRDAAKFGYSRDVGINPQTGQAEYFISDESGNIKWTGAKPVPEKPRVADEPKPQMVTGADGKVYWLKPGEQLPEGVTTKKGSLTPTEFNEVTQQEDTAAASESAIGALNAALALNDTAYSGYGALTRAKARSNLPGESAEANATIEMDSIITEQVLSSLKTMFGGNPTEGERAILRDMQASVEKTPAQRKAIIERAIAAAQKRMDRSRARAESIRSGEFQQPTQQPTAPTATQPPEQRAPQLTPHQQYVREFNAAKAKGDRAKMKWLTEQAIARGIARAR